MNLVRGFLRPASLDAKQHLPNGSRSLTLLATIVAPRQGIHSGRSPDFSQALFKKPVGQGGGTLVSGPAGYAINCDYAQCAAAWLTNQQEPPAMLAEYLNGDFPLFQGIHVRIGRQAGTQAKHDALGFIDNVLGRHGVAGIGGVAFEVLEPAIYRPDCR